MKIVIYLALIVLLVLCIRKIRKMLKDSNQIQLDEGKKPVSGWMVTGIFAFGAVFTALFLWFILSTGSPMEGVRHNIPKYTFKEHTLMFDVDRLNTSYAVSLPLYVDIKPNDKVDVKYFEDRGRIKKISAVFVNGAAVHDGSYQLTYIESIKHN